MNMLKPLVVSVLVVGGSVIALAMPAPVLPIVATPASPQPQGDVVQLTMDAAAGHLKLGLPDFSTPANDPELTAAAKTVADVLWADLDYEREYYLIDRKASATIPVAPTPSLDLKAWTAVGADEVLVGSIARSESGMTVKLVAIDIKGTSPGRELFNKTFDNCRVDNPRLCAHTMADDFHFTTRRLDGIARTHIAFTSDRASLRASGRANTAVKTSKEIYICDYDGENPRRVTVNGNLNVSPVWSPNGGMLAYVSWMTGFPDVYVANLEQAGRPLRTPAGGSKAVENFSPSWSPDGTKMAYASNRAKGGQFDIWVVNSSGGSPENLTPNTLSSSEGAPIWSPNGSQIAFTSDRTGQNQLYVMSAQGTNVQGIVRQYVDRPTWSTKNFIAFTLNQNAPHDIGIYDFASVKILVSGKGSNEAPAVSPNGRHIAFVTTSYGHRDIATIDRDGKNMRQVTRLGNNDYPNWQPMAGQ